MISYIYILLTVLFTVYGQLILKWQLNKAGVLPELFIEKVQFLFLLFLNPWVISCFAAGFLASLTWMAALSRLQLSYAYPFMSLSFLFVLLLSGIFFSETITLPKLMGIGLIMLGIAVSSIAVSSKV